MLRAIKLTGAFALMLSMTALARADETKGSIKTVDNERQEIVLKGTLKDVVYEMKKDANVWLDGTKSKLADLRADDTAHITFEKKGDHNHVIYVRALRNAKDTTGTVRDVFAEKNEVTLKGVVKDTTYELSKTATVWNEGKQLKLSDLREGDQIRITYEQRGDRMMAAEVTMLKRK